jgi:hypothetical protein
LEIFGSLATIIGLICNFKSERRAKTDDEYRDFTQWLEDKRHKDIWSELEENHLLSLSIKSLLGQNHDELMLKLSSIDGALSKLTSKMVGFKEIGQALRKNEELSDQAVSLLKLMNNQSSYILAEVPCSGQTRYGLSDDKMYSIFLTRLPGSGFTQSELRWIEDLDKMFIKDDIEQLLSLGLISSKKEHYGGMSYRITRNAAKYLQALT